MMLIFFVLVAVFQPSECYWGIDQYTSFIKVKEGDPLKIECLADNKFNTSIRWHREPHCSQERRLTLPNGQLSCECGKVLEFPSITRNQRGDYVCSTESESGRVTKRVNVKVMFLPVILETYRVDRFGRELELRCNGEAYPEPEIIWTKENKPLFENEQYEVISDYSCNVYNSTLIISTKSDYYGIYTCRITNKVGHSDMAFDVTDPALRRELSSVYDDYEE